MKTKLTLTAALVLMSLPAFAQNLIANPGFEDIPGPAAGEGILPAPWLPVSITPDTYSVDGSFGITPDTFGNFSGVTAHSGVRWVAAWSAGPETFGQTLAAPLIPGQTYTLSGWIHQALRADLANPGAYRIFLADSSSLITTALVGEFDPNVTADSWEARSFVFTAPANADSLPFLHFVPYDTGSGSAYPGLDDVSLTLGGSSAPEPGTVALLALGVCAAPIARRRRR